jgi:cell division protein FtsI (penicillin-binding protein 3)
MEHVRVTAPDLARRAALEQSRSRLVFAAGFFLLLFGSVVVKLAFATVFFPLQAPHAERVAYTPPQPGGAAAAPAVTALHRMRASITDRNGEILAVSLPTAALYANPKEMIDTDEVAHRLKQVLPQLDEQLARSRLGSSKQFVYLARQITPRQEILVNDLGIPGIYFQPTDQRRYPQGNVAAQVLGAVDVDGHGVAGVEKSFDDRLENDATPLRLSIDVRVQAVVRDVLQDGKDMFSALGACGIVMDVRTGEVIAMVSLPDYDANDFGHAKDDERFNRAVTGMYEPGSTFKLQTAAMALDGGIAHIWDEFNAADPIHIGRFTITDFEGKHRWLYLPEVLAYSSNLGAARIADVVGADRQRAWLRAMGMFSRVGVQLPEAGLPIVPPAANWKQATTMTVGFGHGIAVSPMHVVRGTGVLANGGLFLKPTLLAQDADVVSPDDPRIMQASTSDIIRKLMRLVVTDGYGKPADVPGYFVGGKTGTAEKVGAHGAYEKHANVSAFICVFPMNAPRYAVYMMLDDPHGTKATGGFSTAGAVSAPMAGRVIARIAPMLNLFPDTADMAAIQASLAIPLQPGRPPGWHAAPPVAAIPPAILPADTRPDPRIAPRREPSRMRHEAGLVAPEPDAKVAQVAGR